jgi:hypothetical protein
LVVLSNVPQPGVQLLPEMVSFQVTLVLVEPVTVAENDCFCFTTMVALPGSTVTRSVLVLLLPHPANARHAAAINNPISLELLRHFIPTASPAFARPDFFLRALGFSQPISNPLRCPPARMSGSP